MPELPEVESIRLLLQKFLIGHVIRNIEIRNPKYQMPKEKVLGTRILGIRRFAKVLSIDLSNDFSIVIHIKLTGQLIYRGPNLKTPQNLSKKIVGGIPGPHTHVIFNLDRGGKLYYNDVRRFGWIKIIETDKVAGTGFVGKLGPEPFVTTQGKPPVTKSSSGQAVLTLEYFKNVLSKTSRAIKVVLMDQEKIGGIGNIYANDALWLSKINPKNPAKLLDNEAVKKLFDAIHIVLKAGLKYGGASELAFVTPDGSEGKYQEHTLAYGQEGRTCKRCHTAKIQKYFLSGRGTYWCANCQK